MTSFIMFGTRGWQHVEEEDLVTVDEGLLGVNGREMFVTASTQRGFASRGVSVGQPGWEHRMNDLVTTFVLKGHASSSIARDLYIQLGQDEGRAMSTMNHRLIAQQRVREAVLGFNLLATGNAWKPAMASAFPYRRRDWVEWCDTHIETMSDAAREIRPIDFKASRAYERAGEDLRLIRTAFATSDVMGRSAGNSAGGCFIATSAYGSYDAPQVIVLRQWRDQRLTPTAVGRALVHVYYATSPRLVRTLGQRDWFNAAARRVLDALVRRLARSTSPR